MSELRLCFFCRKERSPEGFVRLRKGPCCPTCLEHKREGLKRVRAQAARIASKGYLDSVMSKPTLQVNHTPLSLKRQRWNLHDVFRITAKERAAPSALAQILL